MRRRVHEFLQNGPQWAVAGYSILFSFTTYFCMYAFRKPFAAASYTGTVHLGPLGTIDWKIVFILAQVVGYTLSKFFGIKLVSEAGADNRGRRILGLMLFSELALVGFALVPMAAKPLFLFLNGLPLGMIWGLVFSYLEGRRLTTLFGATLSASFIVSSGVVKSVAKTVLGAGISEMWMPAVVGLLFLLPLCVSVWALDRLPPPTREEEAVRAKRRPMVAADRRAFLVRYWFPIFWLTALYMVLTAYRDFRDNFAREIWDALGFGASAGIFSATEVPIAVIVLLTLGALALIADPRRSFRTVFALMVAGVVLIGAATFAFEHGWLGPQLWMTSVGLGLFIAYVPFGCIFYDDLLAVTGFLGTAGFMIYVSDAFGYLGSIVVLLYRNFGETHLSWLQFFIGFSYVTSAFCLFGFALAWLSLNTRRREEIAH